MSRQVQPGTENPPYHRTTYTPRDTSRPSDTDPSHQVQSGAQKPPPHNTTYTPRDTSRPSDTNLSRQVQLVPRNPTVATATTQEQNADEQ